MNYTRSIGAAGIFILLAAINGCATQPACPASGCRSDDTTTAAVDAAITAYPDLGPPGQVRVATVNHVVSLTALVDSGYQRSVAESVAAQTDGVTKVVNSIGVSG
jgi:osmotically-inducible protein OsmY